MKYCKERTQPYNVSREKAKSIVTALGLLLSEWWHKNRPFVTERNLLGWAASQMNEPKDTIIAAYRHLGFWQPLDERDTPTQTILLQLLAMEYAKACLGVGDDE